MFTGIGEILLIAVIVLIVFGHKRLPAIGTALGKSVKEFRSASPKEPAKAEANQAGTKENGPASDLISTGLNAIPQVRAVQGKLKAAQKIAKFLK